MEVINYISMIAVPLVILLIISYGLIEKKKVFDIFVEGTKEGLKTTIKILPTLIGLFLAIGALRSSGIIDGIGKMLYPILTIIKFPMEILPLVLLRPISRKCVNSYSNRYNENIWSRQSNRNNSICNNGGNRDNIIYNSNIYRCSKNKKNEIRIVCSTNSRHSWNDYGSDSLSNDVDEKLLTDYVKNGIINTERKIFILYIFLSNKSIFLYQLF